jgi:hypothetical protein
LHQHEEPGDVIKVEVRNENSIDRIVAESGRFEPGAHRLPAIHQQMNFSEAVKKRRMPTVRGGPAVPDAKTFQGKIVHPAVVDLVCHTNKRVLFNRFGGNCKLG